MVTYKAKKELINTLSQAGHQILEIEIADESVFFKVKSFEPPIGGSVSASPFIQFTGIDITEFLDGNVHIASNQKSFIDLFDNKFGSGSLKDRNFKFSDNHKWRYFE